MIIIDLDKLLNFYKMKKLFFTLVLSITLLGASFGQAIADQGVIPVSVTLNQILRLNITSGGNINFVFNTINDYENGINDAGGNAQYQTTFTVASSVNYDVIMYAESANLTGTDLLSNTLSIDNIGFNVTPTGSHTVGTGEITVLPSPSALSAVQTTEIVTSVWALPGDPTNSGDITDNAFTIDWECGTSDGGGMNAVSILDQSLGNDRYATNVFLILAKH